MRKTSPFLCFVPALAMAQTPGLSGVARIDQVLVYPGGAQVERVVAVKAGARELRLPCLPGSFDASSLQIESTAQVAIGEVNVQTVEASAAPECASTPLDARIHELEDQRASIQAESSAQQTTLDFLKQLGHSVAGPQITAAADSVRAEAQAALQRQQPLKRRAEEIERQLKPLTAERDRLRNANPRFHLLTAQISASQDAELHLVYRMPNAGWQPVYRAYLDSASGKVRLERRAQVAQNSGEDWSGVSLRLSTVQPQQAVSGQQPWPWTLNLAPVQVAQDRAVVTGVARRRMYAMAAAPAPEALAGKAGAAPDFDVSVFQGEFATEFQVPNRVNVASSGERVNFELGGTALDARLLARISPQQDAGAFLVAESPRPAGVWPAGEMQMFRDGAFIGESRLNLQGESGESPLDLFFGRDEQILVSVTPEQRDGGTAGFIGSRIEQKRSHVYSVENKHQRAFTVQVLEATPVSQNEAIKVEAKLDPQPLPGDWRQQSGIRAWEFSLAPGAKQALRADYVISYPKDADVTGMR